MKLLDFLVMLHHYRKGMARDKKGYLVKVCMGKEIGRLVGKP